MSMATVHKQRRPLNEQIMSLSKPARLFLLATIMDGIVYSGWGLFFNFYILQRGFSREFLGLVNAIPSLGILLFGIPIGMLSDRIGRKRAMIIGLAISILCMGAEVMAQQPGLILLTAFLGGIASPLYYLSQAPFMMKVSNDDNRTLLFSLNFGFVTLAGALGSGFAGQLPGFFGNVLHVTADSATAYQMVLLFSVILSMFTLVPLMLLKEPASRQEVAGTIGNKGIKGVVEHRSMLETILQPTTIKLALPNMLIGSGAAILIPYMNLFFVDKFKMSDAWLGILFSISSLLTGVGSLLSPRLEKSTGSKVRAVVLTQAGSLAFLLLLGFSPWIGLAAIAFLMRGTLMNMAVPLFDAFSMEQVAEREQGTINSVRSMAWQVGWVVGPYVSGVVQQNYGFKPLFITTALLYACSVLTTWYFFGRKKSVTLVEAPSSLESTPACVTEISGD